MKKTVYRLAIAASIMVTASSCSDFLDQPPLGSSLDTPSYYNDIDNATMAVNSCYDAISYDQGVVNHLQEWMIGDVMSDDAWKGGSDGADFNEIQQLKDWVAQNNNSVTHSAWKTYFQAIYRANTSIQGIEPATFDEDVKNQLLGEARFIRAYSYFYLVRLFGDVPLFTKPVSTDEIGSVKRAPYAEVLALIEEDLKFGIENLPSKSETQIGRANSGVAEAYLARVMMYEIGIYGTKTEAAWQDIYNATSNVINSGEYSLTPNYAAWYEIEGENNEESIFEIQYMESSTGWATANEGTTNSILVGNRGTSDLPGKGWGFQCPTQSLVDEFETGDPRLNCTAYQTGDYVYGEEQAIKEDAHLTGFHSRKGSLNPTYWPAENSDSPANQRKMRYADVLLMNAEAAFHIGNEEMARTRVNDVRKRARQSTMPMGFDKGTMTFPANPASNVLEDITSSGSDLLADIYHERRVELAMEALRYWDLVRTGRYESVLSAEQLANYKTHLLDGKIPVLPIPMNEVATYGLEQNPGY